MVVGVFGCVVYTLGLPVVTLALLYKRRSSLAVSTTEQSSAPIYQSEICTASIYVSKIWPFGKLWGTLSAPSLLSFNLLHRNYIADGVQYAGYALHRGMWFWEFVHFFRKMAYLALIATIADEIAEVSNAPLIDL